MRTNTIDSTFVPSSGEGVKEYHSLISLSDFVPDEAAQIGAVVKAVAAIAGKPGRKVHFVRFLLKDARDAKPAIAKALYDFPCKTVSFIEQPPLDGSAAMAWVYSTEGELNPAYEHIWHAGLDAGGADSECQMNGIFTKFAADLQERGAGVAEDCVRTWIFVHDVDNNYAGVVKGRRDFFDEIGLTADTHYIASTGIQGRNADHDKLVTMDAVSVKGLRPGQIQYLYAKDHLNATYEYGVTFERGTAVHFGDRTTIYISGTASIDNKGQVLHVGDPAKQTMRLLENVSALLSEAESSMADVRMALVYLRNASDYETVKDIISTRCPGMNAVYMLAPVCRPTWLVEMECIAIKAGNNPAFSNL